MWLATPSSYDSSIHDTSPVFIGAFGRWFKYNLPISLHLMVGTRRIERNVGLHFYS
jgi:hypothetical protein